MPRLVIRARRIDAHHIAPGALSAHAEALGLGPDATVADYQAALRSLRH
jgi:hypothetical protein